MANRTAGTRIKILYRRPSTMPTTTPIIANSNAIIPCTQRLYAKSGHGALLRQRARLTRIPDFRANERALANTGRRFYKGSRGSVVARTALLNSVDYRRYLVR